jgi:recombination protein RecA
MKMKKKVETKTESEKIVEMDLKQRVLEFQKQLQKEHGIDVSVGVDPYKIKLYTTGILNLDDALGGGLPVGMITELYGEEQSGKTLISLLSIAEMQKTGKPCLYIDAEFRFNPEFAEKMGVDVSPSMLTVIRKNIVQQVFQIIKEAAESKAFGLIVLDSVGTLVSQEVLEMNLIKDPMRMGGASKAITECSKAIISPLAESGTSMILINQVRDLIGAPVPMKHKTGGNFLSHIGSIRIKVKKPSSQKIFWENDIATGVEIECEIEKSGFGKNFRTAFFRHIYETGLDREYDLLSLLCDKGIIKQAGSFYTYNDIKFHGFDQLIKFTREDENFRKTLISEAEKIISKNMELDSGTKPSENNAK